MSKKASEKEFYTVKEVKEMLGIGQDKVYKMFASGEIPSIKVGRLYRVSRKDFENWQMESRYRSGG